MPKRVLQGVVVSDACDKTVIVRVERRVMHPIYKKFVSRSKKYAAHDEDNRYTVGDAVRIEESRPLSKRKSWVVIEGPAEAAPGRGSRRAAAEAEPAAQPAPRRRRRTAAEAEEAGGAA
jgi:small subunit ribosomal protein S17